MLSEDDKRFFALFLKQRKHEAKFPKAKTEDVEAKWEKKLEARNRLMEETKDLVKKWDKTGLLDGIKSDTQQTNMAVLLESKPCRIMENGEKIVIND